MLSHSTCLEFDMLLPNTSEMVIERQILQINNDGNRIVSYDMGDKVLAKDYSNNNNI